jgi:hypothetical protein
MKSFSLSDIPDLKESPSVFSVYTTNLQASQFRTEWTPTKSQVFTDSGLVDRGDSYKLETDFKNTDS